MPKRVEVAFLVVLLLVLAGVLYRTVRGGSHAAPVAAMTERYQPLPVENPSLRIDMLSHIREFVYPDGVHRNIFSAIPPPPPAPKADPRKVQPPVPQGPQPLLASDVPAKFFGYVADVQGGHRRAFFTNGEDVYIVAEGETLLNRFRLLRITNQTAEVEETASGRRVTLALEEQGPSA